VSEQHAGRVVCAVCGTREVATLHLGPGYVACEPRVVPLDDRPAGAAIRYRWHPSAEAALVRVWCDRHDGWVAFKNVDAIAAVTSADRSGVVRARPC
jgi:hypothetical protein